MESQQRIYPIGVQNFEKIRKDGYVYIDKTALIYSWRPAPAIPS